MEKRVFMVHGWEGSPDNHWFPWLKRELEARYFKVFVPTMPEPDLPNLKEWLDMLADWVRTPNVETYFVGHSLGCITILRYLESLKEGVRVGGCVFVAGFSGNTPIPELEEFYSLPLDVSKAKNHSKHFVSIFSDNDELLPVEKSLEFAQKLGAKVIIEKGKGHFKKSDGSVALQSAFKAILSMAEKNSKK